MRIKEIKKLDFDNLRDFIVYYENYRKTFQRIFPSITDDIVDGLKSNDERLRRICELELEEAVIEEYGDFTDEIVSSVMKEIIEEYVNPDEVVDVFICNNKYYFHILRVEVD